MWMGSDVKPPYPPPLPSCGFDVGRSIRMIAYRPRFVAVALVARRMSAVDDIPCIASVSCSCRRPADAIATRAAARARRQPPTPPPPLPAPAAMAATTDDGNVQLQQLQQNLTSALQHHVKLQVATVGPQLQQQHQQHQYHHALLQQQWYEQQLLQQLQQQQQQQQYQHALPQQQGYEQQLLQPPMQLEAAVAQQDQMDQAMLQHQGAPRKNVPRPGFWMRNAIGMAMAIKRGDDAASIRAMARSCIAKTLDGPV